jgi:hypothetical protein
MHGIGKNKIDFFKFMVLKCFLNSYHDWTASGRWFVFMNYSVHGKLQLNFCFSKK